jgi:hypothetical protein
MDRRHFLSLATSAAALACAPAIAAAEAMQVYKTSGCGCCIGWMKHLERNGFQVTSKDLPHGALMQKKLGLGLRPEQTSCHTGEIGGYVVEGHVPAREVKRLLRERPDAVGLSVPDMPVGSPGMEDGDAREPYDVLLIRRDGSAEVFASYR